MSKTTKLILRLLMSPFLLCIILIRYNYAAFNQTFLAIKYGGEWITYSEFNEKITIKDIYNQLKTTNKNGNSN